MCKSGHSSVDRLEGFRARRCLDHTHHRCPIGEPIGSTQGQQGGARASDKIRVDLAQTGASASIPERAEDASIRF
jgi:hypothetical protein